MHNPAHQKKTKNKKILFFKSIFTILDTNVIIKTKATQKPPLYNNLERFLNVNCIHDTI